MKKLEEKELLQVAGGGERVRYCWQADGKKDECRRPHCNWSIFTKKCIDNSGGHDLGGIIINPPKQY